jgi:hypothetical protein
MSSNRPAALIATLLASALCTVAAAQTPSAAPQANAAAQDDLDAQIAAWTKAPDPAAAAAGGGDQPAPPRQIHGEAGVSVGSSGYRAGYITTDIPIGKDSDLGLAVGESEIKPKHFGTITNKSLAVSLNIGAGDLGGGVKRCSGATAPTDGRYLEPVWVSRMHGEALARDQADCAAPGAPAARP